MTPKDRFPEESIQAIYDVIFKRRDVRSFLPDDISDDTILRLLKAAHHAPSVGFMQPWNFIVIRDGAIKKKIKDSFTQAHIDAANKFTGEKKETYKNLKLEGIMEAPVNLCVTCDSSRFGPNQIGRNSMPEMDLYSVCCAVENLWLSARAEGIGVGWVSILQRETLNKVLKIPAKIIPVAYLCIGIPKEFHDIPELEKAGWAPRLPLDELIFSNQWGVK